MYIYVFGKNVLVSETVEGIKEMALLSSGIDLDGDDIKKAS